MLRSFCKIAEVWIFLKHLLVSKNIYFCPRKQTTDIIMKEQDPFSSHNRNKRKDRKQYEKPHETSVMLSPTGERFPNHAACYRPRAKGSRIVQHAFAHGRKVPESCSMLSPTGERFPNHSACFRPRAKGSRIVQHAIAHGREHHKTGESLIYSNL